MNSYFFCLDKFYTNFIFALSYVNNGYTDIKSNRVN